MASLEFYLTAEKKSKYMSDFRKLLNLTDSKFWEINKNIKETLIKINQNPVYQTLYSKSHEILLDTWNLGAESYLDITSYKNTWPNLYDTLNQVKNCSSYNSAEIEINDFDPHDNFNLNPNSCFNIGCIKDPDYFRIKYLRISIKSPDYNCHENFWSCVADKFSPL